MNWAEQTLFEVTTWSLLLNENFLLQCVSLATLFFFLNTFNLLTLWYLAGIFLILLGFLLLNDDGDVFIGFLWVIDLGVGLIFFIFILHFSNFLYQKANYHLFNKFFLQIIFFFLFFVIFFFLASFANAVNFNFQLSRTWYFFISWYNYFFFFNSFTVTDLNLLREIYFYSNSFEFFLINFMVFYGIFSSINLTFLIKRIFLFLNFSQIKNVNALSEVNSYFFIRNQNFLKQQNTSAGARVWLKKKYSAIRDF